MQDPLEMKSSVMKTGGLIICLCYNSITTFFKHAAVVGQKASGSDAEQSKLRGQTPGNLNGARQCQSQRVGGGGWGVAAKGVG